MATAAEIRAGLDDYRQRCNDNARLRKMLRSWTRHVHFVATDTGDTHTVTIDKGEITDVQEGAVGTPDLVISATSEDLTDMFWGDLNPAAKYLTGEIAVKGSADDVMRVDAMAALIWVDA
jgi:putative sterol carrier protein